MTQKRKKTIGDENKEEEELCFLPFGWKLMKMTQSRAEVDWSLQSRLPRCCTEYATVKVGSPSDHESVLPWYSSVLSIQIIFIGLFYRVTVDNVTVS